LNEKGEKGKMLAELYLGIVRRFREGKFLLVES